MTEQPMAERIGPRTLRFERRLAHPPERVWRALTDPAELAIWLVAAAELEPRVWPVHQDHFIGYVREPTGTTAQRDPHQIATGRPARTSNGRAICDRPALWMQTKRTSAASAVMPRE